MSRVPQKSGGKMNALESNENENTDISSMEIQ